MRFASEIVSSWNAGDGRRAPDDERLEILRADRVLALLGVAHHGLDVAGPELVQERRALFVRESDAQGL